MTRIIYLNASGHKFTFASTDDAALDRLLLS
jgi:hypothetical protein